MNPWKDAGYGPLLCEPAVSLVMSTSGTTCSRPSPPGGGILTVWMPRPSNTGGRSESRQSRSGEGGRYVRRPRNRRDVRGLSLHQDRDPCGMLAMRTMLGGFGGSRLAGTSMNSPGSRCSACPAVENGGGSASVTRCR